MTAMGFFTVAMGTILYEGPRIDNPILRYCCGGAAATLLCEVMMHAVDTINMRSKLVNAPKMLVLNMIRNDGVHSLLRGIQPVMYGYCFSSFVYFFSYAHSKMILTDFFFNKKNREQSKSSFY